MNTLIEKFSTFSSSKNTSSCNRLYSSGQPL
jgi:hypothetical protein